MTSQKKQGHSPRPERVLKNDRFVLDIEGMSAQGLGLGRREGFVWFVKDTLPGDRVVVSAMKQKKNYGYARLVDLLSSSEDRTEASCPVSRACGGCQLQSMAYKAQLRYKEDKIRQQFRRIGGIGDEEWTAAWEGIQGMPHPWRYRNKAQYPVRRGKDGHAAAGFYAGRTHVLVSCGDCLLEPVENGEMLRQILSWMDRCRISPYEEEGGTGLVRHILIRKGFRTGQHMVCLVVNGSTVPHIRELADSLRGSVDSLCLSIHTGRDNVIMGKEILPIQGSTYIEDRLMDLTFRISPLSFYQVNPEQTEAIYAAVLSFADLHGTEVVWDLYAGIGSISLVLARYAKAVYGVEVVPEAVRDARENAMRNGISNARFLLGDVEELLGAAGSHEETSVPDLFIEKEGRQPLPAPDLVVVDPPRKGVDRRCLSAIAAARPAKILYVSCEPSSLARDLQFLLEQGYALRRIRAIDNFPQSVHVETVCLLSNRKRKPDSYVKVSLDMEDYYKIKDEQKAKEEAE